MKSPETVVRENVQLYRSYKYHEPMSRNMQLPYYAYVRAFLQIDLFLAYLFFSKIKAVPVQ